MTDVVLKLSARDLLHADLASCGWAGSAHHLAGVARQLERARLGEVDYLAVCPATDIPVAKGGVDYQVKEGVGTLWQLAVQPALQSCGIGTFLVQAAELRIRNRGLRHAELGVEENNPGPGRCTSAWAMSRTTASPTRGKSKLRTGRCAATRRCARCCARISRSPARVRWPVAYVQPGG